MRLKHVTYMIHTNNRVAIASAWSLSKLHQIAVNISLVSLASIMTKFSINKKLSNSFEFRLSNWPGMSRKKVRVHFGTLHLTHLDQYVASKQWVSLKNELKFQFSRIILEIWNE